MSFEYKFGFDDRMIMDRHFGLMAFYVANGWNVLGMVIFIYRMPFGSDDIRTDYDATSSVLSELHWWTSAVSSLIYS